MNKNAIKYLRGISHNIKPVVMVADKGLTENVMNEIDIALDKHELIKIKIRTDRETRNQFISEIVNQTNSEQIHSIGQTLTIFRRNPKNPQYEI
ncbi:MAG TPA: YhbY family RNA-binding protein [Gammaproteobacteria bacterium]|nr:YhbY family RNA-binding protein [Xanthomonadales bacterium]MCB1593948.1 YhbY family RNA-binding protein [Xanthomonadales bacterium]HOP21364.1 YhbY family RNA-binding protein [Gammaproteobacteria bacterium]HPI94776.1 YhbY family RNA-binding protein [Gammaproteobacteria bacterium]HPQ86369.1 YhbY family RNA-binding protein [Gammaproteobacteria bacterium]